MPYRAFKSKILLSHIAERNHNGRGYNLCDGRKYMKLLHKQADENIVQDYADQNKDEIPEKLNTSVKDRSGKYHVPHQHKAGWKTDKK